MQSLFADLFGRGVFVSVYAKPLVLGPLGRVSGAVLSLIRRSAPLHHCLAKTLSLCAPTHLLFVFLLSFSHTFVFLGFLAFLGSYLYIELKCILEVVVLSGILAQHC